MDFKKDYTIPSTIYDQCYDQLCTESLLSNLLTHSDQDINWMLGICYDNYAYERVGSLLTCRDAYKFPMILRSRFYIILGETYDNETERFHNAYNKLIQLIDYTLKTQFKWKD